MDDSVADTEDIVEAVGKGKEKAKIINATTINGWDFVICDPRTRSTITTVCRYYNTCVSEYHHFMDSELNTESIELKNKPFCKKDSKVMLSEVSC